MIGRNGKGAAGYPGSDGAWSFGGNDAVEAPLKHGLDAPRV